MTKRLILSLIGMMFCLITWSITTPEEGKYYRIVNQNPEKSITTEGIRRGFVITENGNNHTLTCEEPGADDRYDQLWYYTNKKFRNAKTQRYITSLSRSVQAVTAVSGTTVTLTDKSSYFLLTCGMQIHADGSNKIVGWNDEGNKSNWWDFEEIEVNEEDLAVVQAQYKKEQEEKTALESIAAKNSTYAPIVEGYFTDAACTELKAEHAAKTDAQMKETMAADGLPEEVQAIVLRIKNKWADEFNPAMSAKFRVQSYKCYTQSGAKSLPKATQLSDQNNPTGIWTNTLQLMYVFVDNDIPAGTSLRIASSDGPEVSRVWWNNGSELHKGMNTFYCSSENAYQWIMYTAPAAIGSRIDRFPEIKIHIEGGRVLGYADIAGLDEDAANAEYEATLKNAKAIMADAQVSTKKVNFAVKGERGLMLYPVDAYDQIWSDKAWNGKVYGYKIYKSMKFYDNVLMWEWSAMGWQDRAYNGEATAEKTRENLAAGIGDSWYPSYINNLAPTMMLYAGKNPYSSDGYTCMPSVGAIESSYNAERADFDTWCVGHESGHNNQSTINLPSSMESSNNYFSNIITYLNGYRMSRGMTFMENMSYYESNTIFPLRDISITLRMYFNLYLYYHRAQNNMAFTQRLHQLLRADGMTFGGNGWYDGPEGGANRGSASTSWLKFYEKACEAAQEDLTEYFRLWGFFIPVTDAYCGDYSSYYITCTQKDIDAAIARVKKKGYPENKQIMFIEDRLKPQLRYDVWATGTEIKPTNDGRLGFDEAKLKEWYGDIGYVDEYMSGKASAADYSFSAVGRNVTMKGTGGVGFIVYDDDNNIVYMSNRLKFTLPAAVAAKPYHIVTIQGDGVEVPARDALENGTTEELKDALQAAIDASKDYTSICDDKTVGFYSTESLSTLNTLVAQGENAITTSAEDQYKAMAQQIGSEIINVSLNAKKNELKTNAVYTLRNFEFKGKGGKSYLSGTDASAVNDANSENSQWLFVPTADGKYNLQCRGTLKLISNVGDNGAFKTEAESTSAAYAINVAEAPNGTFYLQFVNADNKTRCINETPSWNGIISWSEGDGSRWYISEVEEIEGITGEELNALIAETKSLIEQAGTITTAVQKLPLQCTDANAPYYIKTNREDSAYPIANLIDSNKATTFRTKSGGTNMHNFTVDLGEGNEANYLRLTCITSQDMDGHSPRTIIAMPSTGMSTGFVSAEKTEFTALPAGTTAQESYYRDTKEAAKPYRYWRFQVSEINTNSAETRPYFSLAYIQLRTLVATVTLNDKYSTLDTKYLKAANNACTAAQNKLNVLNTLLSNQNNYDELKAAFDALLAAMEEIAPTGITGVDASVQNNGYIYDISGRRVANTNKAGIYIIGGKKVVVK